MFTTNNDIRCAAKFATRYASGVDDDTMEIVVQALRDLKVDLQRRAETIKGLPVELCPDGKVTRSLANRRTLGLTRPGVDPHDVRFGNRVRGERDEER
jgi:hypothetical protein